LIMANISISLAQIQRSLFALALFIRFSALGGTLVLALLGAASVSPYPSNRTLLGILGVGLAFHLFAYVTNDVIDLELDRTEPRRVDFPLVIGSITRSQALILAILMVPLALTLTMWMEGNIIAFIALAASFLLVLAYNIWGKRAPFPPLTDFIQGLGWGAFVLFGAAMTATSFAPATAVVFVFIVIFIVLANGVHGSLRDLTNDLRCNVRSTAILLGASPSPGGGLKISSALRIYAIVLNVALICLAILLVIVNYYVYSRFAWAWTTGSAALLAALSLVTLFAAARSTQNQQKTYSTGMLNLLITMNILVVAMVPAMNGPLLILTVAVFILPLLTHSWFTGILRDLFWRGRIG
jgi:4-hydroxybenzoate polyprenyltransferase